MKGNFVRSKETGLFICIDTKADLSDKERTLLDLTLGAPPKNKEEKRLAWDIKKIKGEGFIVDIPET